MNEQDIRGLVAKLLLFSTEGFQAEYKLKELGEAAEPALVEALSDPRFWQRQQSPGLQMPRAPVDKPLSLLRPFGCPEQIPFLLPVVGHPDKYFRQEAAIALGSIAADECIEPVKLLLADTEDFVRSYAMIGIDWALRGKRGTPRFLDAMFEAVIPLLDRADESQTKAPRTLLLIDRDRAIPTILNKQFFHLANPVLLHILYAVNEFEVTVPVEKLSNLMNPISDKLGAYPNDAIYGACLIALARIGHPAAEPAIRECLKSSNKHLATDAAEAMAVLKRASKVIQKVFKRMEDVGFDSLTEPEQVFASVRMLIDEVNNGGFDQYFGNSSGDYATDALNGLRAIDVRHAEELLRRAIGLFGSEGPSPDADTRRSELEQLPEPVRDEFSKLDESFYKDADEIEKKLHLYVAANRSSFK